MPTGLNSRGEWVTSESVAHGRRSTEPSELTYASKIKPEFKMTANATYNPLVEKLRQICPGEYKPRIMMDGEYKDILGTTSKVAYERVFGVKLIIDKDGNWTEDKAVVVPSTLEDSIYQICVIDGGPIEL